MSEKIILIIKVANQGSVDQRLECELDWNILRLKEEISQSHPTRPTIGEQRLIYSGQLLEDALTLKTILRHPSDNNEYIIHMVCSTTRTIPVNQIDNSNLTSTTPSPGSGNSSSETDSNSDGLRHRIVTSEQQIPALGVQQGFDTSVYSTLPQFPFSAQAINDPVQQMAMMQQMYAQYMASYMQYIQYGGIESGTLLQDQGTAVASPSSAITNPNEGDNIEINQQGVLNAPNNEPEQQRNAQGRGPAEELEEEGGARDWLDYLYFGSRMVILLSIVYFYSTLARFVIVSSISIFIYMYQRGGARARRERGGDIQPQEQQQPQQQQQQQQLNQGQNANNEGDANGVQAPNNADASSVQPGPEGLDNNDDDGAGSSSSSAAREEAAREGTEEERSDNNNIVNENERTRRGGEEEGAPGGGSRGGGEDRSSSAVGNPTREEEVTPPQPSILALSWTFLTTFFTSLIPEQHQIV